MKTSALFMVAILVSVAYCDDNILSFIDKSPQGKEVLDTIALQVKAMGKHLSVGKLNAALKNAQGQLKNAHDDIVTKVNAHNKGCHEDKKQLGNKLREFLTREYVVGRHIDAAERLIKRKQMFLRRVSEETHFYEQFAHVAKEAYENWQKFWKLAQGTAKKIHHLVHAIKDKIENIHNAHHKGAFVELDNDYFSTLTQLETSMEDLNDDVLGVKPILANLVQIMQNKHAVNKERVRLSILRIIHSIAHKTTEFLYRIGEEHAHQANFFEALHNSYVSFDAKSEGLQKKLKEEIADASALKAGAESSHSIAKGLVHRLQHIMSLRKEQCSEFKLESAAGQIMYKKFLGTLGELQGLMLDHFGKLKTFFLEREFPSSD